MHILEVIPVLRLAGAEIMCETLSKELKKKGHKITIVSFYNEETEITNRLINAGIEIIFLGKHKGIDFSIVKKIKKVIQDRRPDIIHTHLNTLKYVAIALVWNREMNIPIVHTIHNVAEKEVTKLDQKFHKYLYNKKKAYPVAISQEIKKTTIECYDLRDEDVSLILNGVDLNQCIPKKTYICENERFVFLHVARFAPQKNNFNVVQAFKQVYDVEKEIELWLIGNGDKNIIEKIQKYIKDNKLEDNVKIMVAKASVYEDMHNADVFLLPSIYEGMPLTIIEAMGTGLPIIATAVGGVPDVIRDHVNGILIDCNIETLAKTMKECLYNISIRQKIGENALKDSKKYNSERMAESYLKLFCKLLRQ